MPFGFGPTYGTGTADIIKTTVPVGVMTPTTCIYLVMRGYIVSAGGGSLGRYVELVDSANVTLSYGATSTTTGTMARIGSVNSEANSAAITFNAPLVWSGAYIIPQAQVRSAINNTNPASGILATAATSGDVVHVAIGNSASLLTRHYDGLIDEVGVWLGNGVGLGGFGATIDRRQFTGHPLCDAVNAEATMVFYADGKSLVNLIDSQPLTASGAKVYLTSPKPFQLNSYGFRPSSMTRDYGNPRVGWPQMSRVLSDVR